MHSVAENVLNAYSFYRDGSRELRSQILDCARAFDRDELREDHLFVVGDGCDHIFLVGGGGFRVYVSGLSGRGVLLYNVLPGEICPLNVRMVLSNTVALASADPSPDLVAVALHRDAVRSLSASFEQFRLFVQQAVADRFEEIIIRISDITTRRVDHRLLDFLIAEFNKSAAPKPTIAMTNDDIALAVGAAREVVNRKLHEFESVGALSLGRGRIWLQDHDALQALAKPKLGGL
jgi:CRP/FNR family transcriptional regulator